MDLLSQIGIIPQVSVPVDENGPTTDERSNHQSTKRFEPTDGKLVETIPNSTDFNGDVPELIINGADDNDRYLKCKLPTFRTIHEVLEFVETLRDELIEDFNVKARSEYLGPTLALRSKAKNPFYFKEVHSNIDSSDDNPNIVRFECDVSKFTAMSDVWLTAGKFQSKLVRAYQALDRPAPILKLFASFE